MAFENGAAAGAVAGTVIPGVGNVVGGAVGGILGTILGPNKNLVRDQQEAARFKLASGGDVASAQGIYHDAQPGSGATHERQIDDQGYWGQLLQLGWTVNAQGIVSPPAGKTQPNQPGAGQQSGIFGQLFKSTATPGNGPAGTNAFDWTPIIVGGVALIAVVGIGAAVMHRGK